MKETIGFCGLGQMGRSIALRLVDAGYPLRVFNRTPEKGRELAERGAFAAASPAAAAEGADIVFTMLADDRAVEDVCLGDDGLLHRLRSGAIHVSMSTIGVESARRLAAAHAGAGVLYVSAPVFGRPEAVAAGRAWIVVAGPETAKEALSALWPAIGQGAFDVGTDPSAANVVKLAGNFLIAAAIQGMAEAFALAEKNGIERSRFADILTETLFACPAYRTYGPLLAKNVYRPAAFPVPLASKDMRLVLELAEASHVPMPVGSVVHDTFLGLTAQGYDDLDWSSLGFAASRNAGLA